MVAAVLTDPSGRENRFRAVGAGLMNRAGSFRRFSYRVTDTVARQEPSSDRREQARHAHGIYPDTRATVDLLNLFPETDIGLRFKRESLACAAVDREENPNNAKNQN